MQFLTVITLIAALATSVVAAPFDQSPIPKNIIRQAMPGNCGDVACSGEGDASTCPDANPGCGPCLSVPPEGMPSPQFRCGGRWSIE